MKNYKTVIGAAAVGLALAAVSTQAQINLTGGTVVGSSLDQELVGVSPGGNVGANNGTVTTWVISGAAADPNGLIFIYQVVNRGADPIDNAEFTGFAGPDVISASDYASFTGTLTLTDEASPAAGSGSGTRSNFTSENTFGDTATFEGGDLGNAGGTSDLLAVLTSDTLFSGNYGSIQDAFSAQGNTLAPVPEANTIVAGALMLLPLGIGAVRALRKERVA